MKLLCMMLALACVASADTINPYGVPSPGAFAMSTAGGWTGSGTGILNLDNRSLFPATDQVSVGLGVQSTSAAYQSIPGNNAAAQAIADVGIFKIAANYFDATGGFHDHTEAIADAGWLDFYTISDATHTGQNGVLTFLVHADGQFTGAGGATWALGVSSNNALDFSTTEGACDWRFVGSSPCPLNINSDYLVSVPFVFGTGFEMMIRSFTRAGLPSIGPSGPPNLGTDVNFLNTIYWAGIQSVKVGGQSIDGYSISAASGADYTHSFAPVSAVPEPGAFGMLALGLVAIGYAARTRRSSS